MPNSPKRTWINPACLLMGLLACALAGANSEPVEPVAVRVFHAPLTMSLDATGGAIAFHRASRATFFDATAGCLKEVPADTPRFVSLPADGRKWGEARGILLESASSNLLVDSSFELGPVASADIGEKDPSSAWEIQGAGTVARRAGAGIHGGHALAVTGGVTLMHSPVKVSVYKHPCVYWLSLYARRDDGGTIGPDAIRCSGRPIDPLAGTIPWNEAQQIRPLPPVRLGEGPWYRVSARIGWSQEGVLYTNDMRYGFVFDGGAYLVDAAQLEPALGNQHHMTLHPHPSAYIPTYAAPVGRAADQMSAPAQALLPGRAWTYAFWHYAAFPRSLEGRDCRLFSVWGPNREQWLATTCGGVASISADLVPEQGWMHGVVTYDGERLDYFINGESQNDLTGPVPVSLPVPLTGTACWAAALPPPPWGGEMLAPCAEIADFATWDRALTPAEVKGLYRTGTPAAFKEERKPGDVPITFTVPAEGRTSVNIYRTDGRLVHQLTIGTNLPVGRNTLFWDGCDDDGMPVPLGNYVFRGLVSNVRSVWDTKIGNTSPSPGGEWLQYRTGVYYDVVALPDGGVVTISSWGEHGRAIQALGGPPDYPVRWNANVPGSCMAAAARDDTHLYAAGTRTLPDGTVRETISRFRLSDGAFVPYAQESAWISEKGEIWVTPARRIKGSLLACSPQEPYLGMAVRGLAVNKERIYVTLADENRIAVVAVSNGQTFASLACPAPRKIAVDGRGMLVVTCSNSVERIDPASGARTVLVPQLLDPCGIAVAPGGDLYVTDLGANQQLRVHGADGALKRTFGRPGGHRGGRVAPDLLEGPLGVTVGPDGTVFLSDLGGRRVLAMTSEFAVKKEILGFMPYVVGIDRDDPDRVYLGWPTESLYEYVVAPESRVARMTRRWRYDHPCQQGWGWRFHDHDQPVVRHWGGRAFMVWGGHMAIAELDGDNLLPRVLLGFGKTRVLKTLLQGQNTGFAERIAERGWTWRDRNLDGTMQEQEFEIGDWPLARGIESWHLGSFMDDDGNVYNLNSQFPVGVLKPAVVKFPFEGLDDQGLPIYGWNTAHEALVPNMTFEGKDGKSYPVRPFYVTRDSADAFYIGVAGEVFTQNWHLRNSLMKFSRDGNLLWQVGRRQVGNKWRPGLLPHVPELVDIVADRYLFLTGYLGEMYVWDTDGLFVGMLFADLPEGFHLPGETIGGGRAFRHPDGKVYAISSPDCVYRAARIVVDGLDTVERFDGRLRVTTAATPRDRAEEEPVWRILSRREPIWIDGVIDPREWGTDTDTQAPETFHVLGQEKARSWAQWDGEALYLAWRIRDDSPAVNHQRGESRWSGDQVEFMIRAQAGTGKPSGNMRHGPTEYQLAIGTDADGREDVYVLVNGSDRQGAFLKGAEVRLQKQPGVSYTMEARIPWASLGDYYPADGDQVLWNMIVDWGTPDGQAQQDSSKWKAGVHMDPQTWGAAVFEK
ncbi:MAG: sugar-binding protein [Kiritimatiellae bacterium]|nr:sugar-binding protein [Kiritimatiellia bacterium]